MPEQVTFDAQRNPSNTRAAARCFNRLLLNQVKWHNAHVNRSSHARSPQAAIPEAGNWLVEVALAAHTQFHSTQGTKQQPSLKPSFLIGAGRMVGQANPDFGSLFIGNPFLGNLALGNLFLGNPFLGNLFLGNLNSRTSPCNLNSRTSPCSPPFSKFDLTSSQIQNFRLEFEI